MRGQRNTQRHNDKHQCLLGYREMQCNQKLHPVHAGYYILVILMLLLQNQELH